MNERADVGSAPCAADHREPPGAEPGGSRVYRLLVRPARQYVDHARRDLMFCGAWSVLGTGGIALLALAAALPFVLAVASSGLLLSGHQHAHPPRSITTAALLMSLVAGTVLVPRAGRTLGALHRHLAARVTGERIASPPARRREGRILRRIAEDAGDGPAWRAVAYLILKSPVTAAEAGVVLLAGAGLADLTCPVWWRAFGGARPAGFAVTPVSLLRIDSFPGAFAAAAIGAGMLLAAPWIAWPVAVADRWLMRELLSAGQLARRVADLEETRTIAVEDSAAMLRRLERDLHDGAQIRLATLAMNLGLARRKLGDDADPEVRELIDAAHSGAKEAIAELRRLARGIHPPVLDSGLPDALESLADASAVPVRVTTSIEERPSPAIETIAYFCASELLANAVKHSDAGLIEIAAAGRKGTLRLCVSDDGRGGASASGGSGLAGLVQRVRTVDGRIDILSPVGGPTRITVALPVRA